MVKLCSFASGSSGNSFFFSNGNTKLLIDAGISCKRILTSLNSLGIDIKEINGILITHEHSDHVKGLSVLLRRHGIPIYLTLGTLNAIESSIESLDCKKINVISPGMDFFVNDIKIKAFSIPHDAAEPVGYSLYADQAKISFATDLGYVTDEIKCNLEGSDIVIIEANHDAEMLRTGRYPFYLKRRISGNNGHLSNEQTGKFLASIRKNKSMKILLAHLSKENNYPELARLTVENIIRNSMEEKGLEVTVLNREQMSEIFQIAN